MKLENIKTLVLFAAMLFVIVSCKKDDNAPTTGTIEGTVVNFENANNLAGVRIIVFDANTNAPTSETNQSDANGNFKITLDPGTYYLKLSKLGFESIPRQGMSAIPLSVVAGEITSNTFEMTPSAVTNGGVISGKVSAGENNVGGVLVIAENTNGAYSSVSDGNGNYYIFNIPADNYKVTGWIAGYNNTALDITVEAGVEHENTDLELIQDATATVSGSISFLATSNIEVDVTLVHPTTKETIPGLSTLTAAGVYTIVNVPDGMYLGRASYMNDLNVIDPDWIVKNGEPYINVAGSDISLNFSVTNAVSLLNPTNEMLVTQPIEVSRDTLQFTWAPYSSASDYVIEVMDENGSIIWGGFAADWSQKNITIPNNQTSVAFDFDGSASGNLEMGRVYRWRIYASKNDKNASTGWRLISVSEDQMGLFKIVE